MCACWLEACVAQPDAGKYADVARTNFDEARHRRDRAIALLQSGSRDRLFAVQWTAFRQRVKAADAVLFVTPEYNRSMPAVLKNALDVGSRPYGSSVWDRKPGAIVSCSPSAIGAFGAIII
jgi:NAD(P)H-dependent FMN reductase